MNYVFSRAATRLRIPQFWQKNRKLPLRPPLGEFCAACCARSSHACRYWFACLSERLYEGAV